MERQEHNQGLKDTFTEEFGEWENCINATIKETPKHKFIRSLPGCNSREIDCGKPPFHKSALKKPDITNKADKKFKAKAEMEKMERIRKLSDILQQYNTLVDKQLQQEISKAEMVANNDKVHVQSCSPTIYSDFVSSTLPNGLTKHTANQIVTRADDKIKSSRQEKANETFISRIYAGKLVIKNGCIVNFPSHKVILNNKKRLMKVENEKKMLQQQLDSNVGMKDLQTCGRQKDNKYTLGQLSRQPLVHFHEKVQNGEVGSQNSSKQFLHGASAKNIIGKINKFHDYHVRKPRERRKRKSLRQHNTSSVSAKPYKPRALDYSKIFNDLHSQYVQDHFNGRYRPQHMVEKIFLQEVPCMAKESTEINQPEKPGENNTNPRNHLKKTSSQHWSLSQIPPMSFLKTINVTKRQWKKLPRSKQVAHFKTEIVISNILNLRKNTAIQPDQSAF